MSNETPQIFDGYRITRPAFASGSVSIVHDAVDPAGRRVAIKVFDSEAVEKKIAEKIKKTAHAPSEITEKLNAAHRLNVEKFKEEYQILTGLNHPNVAKALKIGFFENRLYIASEFIDGKPIAEFVRGSQPEKMIPLFIRALDGLDYIHRNGLVHLDIKSQNVLVRMENGKPEVKIIDFGLAMSPLEYEGGFLGSPSYMAPEIILGLKDKVDARADLFSFGVLMYHCITWGFYPFPRPTKAGREELRRFLLREPLLEHKPPSSAHSKHSAEVPEFLDTIVMRLLAHDPKDRFYGNARAVMNALATHAPDAFSEAPGARASYLIPEGDRHIGNFDEQSKVFATIDALAGGETPSPAVIEISGAQGTGKSHLLKKFKEQVERHADKLAIKKIELPADEVAVKKFEDDVTLWASENKLPAVVLIDGADQKAAGLLFPHGVSGNPVSVEVDTIIKNLLNTISKRESKPELYAGTKPLMLVFTTNRYSEPAKAVVAGEESRQILTIRLSPFTTAELKEYLASTPAFKGREVSDKKIAELHSLTGGIQAEVIEQLRESDSEGLIFSLIGEIVMSDLKRRKKAPATTEARFQKTYESLQPEERRILDFLSVWGFKDFTPSPDFETISHFVPSPFVAVRVNNLVETEILKKTSTHALTYSRTCTLSFTNPYFSTFIYNKMAVDDRKLLHDRIRTHLTMKGDDRDIAAFHRCYGSDEKKALRSVIRLGQKTLVQKGNVYLAREFFEHGLNLAVSAEPKLFACLAALAMDAYQQAGLYDRSQSLFDRTITLLGGRYKPWQTVLVTKRVCLAIQQRQFELLPDLFKMARTLLPETASTPLSLIISNYAARERYEFAMTDAARRDALLGEAEKLYRENMMLEEKLPQGSRVDVLNNNLALVLIARGNYPEAITEFEKKIRLHRKIGDPFGILFSTVYLADANRLAGNFDAAIRLARKAVDLAKRAREGIWLWRAHHTLANVYHDTDRFEDALAENDVCLASSAFIKGGAEYKRNVTSIWVQKGHCYKELREFDKALLHFQAAIDAKPDPFFLMSAHEGIGETLLGQGKFSESIRHFDAAQKLLDAMPESSAPTYRDSVRKFNALAVESMKSSLQK